MSWNYSLEVPGFKPWTVVFTNRKAILVCKDNFGNVLWESESNVAVPNHKPSKKRLCRLAGEVYSEYMRLMEKSVDKGK